MRSIFGPDRAVLDTILKVEREEATSEGRLEGGGGGGGADAVHIWT